MSVPKRLGFPRVLVGSMLIAAWLFAGTSAWLQLLASALTALYLAPYALRATSKCSSEAALRVSRAFPPPNSPYELVATVHDGSWKAEELFENAAKKVFGAWAKRLPKTSSNAASLVSSVKQRWKQFSRLVTKLEERTVVWHEAVVQGQEKVGTAPLSPNDVDPWSDNPEDVAHDSKHVGACTVCEASGKVRHDRCAGSAQVRCWVCGGSRSQISEKTGKSINCKGCRGKGQRKCPDCKSGKVTCSQCQGKKRVIRWLQVQSEFRLAMALHPPTAEATAMRWANVSSLDAETELTQDVSVVCSLVSVGNIPQSSLPGHEATRALEPTWMSLQPVARSSERIVYQELHVVKLPIAQVTYSLCGVESHSVDFVGKRLLAPPASQEVAFHARSRLLNKLALALCIVPAAIGITYLARGPFFQSSLVAGTVGAIVLTALLAYGVTWNHTLRRPMARPMAIGALASMSVAAALAFFATPSLSHVDELLDAQKLSAAQIELAAFQNRGTAAVEARWNRYHLARLRGAEGRPEAERLLRTLSETSPEHDEGERIVEAFYSNEIKTSLEHHELAKASRLLAEASTHLKDSERGHAYSATLLSGNVEEHLARHEWEAAYHRIEKSKDGSVDRPLLDVERSKVKFAIQASIDDNLALGVKSENLKERVAAVQQALTEWDQWIAPSVDGNAPSSIVMARRLLPKNAKKLEKLLAKEAKAATKSRKKAEREQKRMEAKAAKERKREERRLLRAQRAYAPLECRDGSYSPTCTCSGSRQGCCSRHGGVRGCSQ